VGGPEPEVVFDDASGDEDDEPDAEDPFALGSGDEGESDSEGEEGESEEVGDDDSMGGSEDDDLDGESD
jgi:hypothetical protein